MNASCNIPAKPIDTVRLPKVYGAEATNVTRVPVDSVT